MIWEELGFFLVQERSRGQHSPLPPLQIFWKIYAIFTPRRVLADWTFVFYLKSFVGRVQLNGAVFWWFGNSPIKTSPAFCSRLLIFRNSHWFGTCFLVTFEEFQTSCNRKSRGPHGENIMRLRFFGKFHVSFSHHQYWKLRYRWHWVIGVHFILFFFLIPPYFSPFSPSRPIFSYVRPLASSPLPHPLLFPLSCTRSTPHLPAHRLTAVVVTEPWIWRPIR